MNLIAFTLLAATAAGLVFVTRNSGAARSALKRDDAAHDLVHDFADDPRPASLLVTGSSFHETGPN